MEWSFILWRAYPKLGFSNAIDLGAWKLNLILPWDWAISRGRKYDSLAEEKVVWHSNLIMSMKDMIVCQPYLVYELFFLMVKLDACMWYKFIQQPEMFVALDMLNMGLWWWKLSFICLWMFFILHSANLQLIHISNLFLYLLCFSKFIMMDANMAPQDSLLHPDLDCICLGQDFPCMPIFSIYIFDNEAYYLSKKNWSFSCEQGPMKHKMFSL